MNLVLSGVVVDLDAASVAGGPLTRLEVGLLRHLAAAEQGIVSNEELLSRVWGYRAGVRTRTVATAVYRLRQKLGPVAGAHLRSHYGQGYSLRLDTVPRTVPGNIEPKRTLGRAEAVRRVNERFRTGSMVQLLGPPGVGKTHLAEHIASTDAYDEAWRIDLSTARTRIDLVEAVSRVLDLGGRAGGRVDVEAALGSRGGVLLVLDGAEGLDGIEEIASDWGALAGLRCLVVSRVALPTLPAVRLEPLAVADAVAMLALRAGLDPSSSGLEELVGRMDRLPLAIELAAARVEALGIDGVVDVPTSLRESIRRSWSLLSPPSRRMLVRIAVARGGLGLAVLRALGAADEQVAECVAAALLQPSGDAASRRFRMLDSVRQFALDVGDEAEILDAQRVHAVYYAANHDVGNAWIAWRRLRSVEPELARRVARPLFGFYWRHGPLERLEELAAFDAEDALSVAWLGMVRTRTHRLGQGLDDLARAAAMASYDAGEVHLLRSAGLAYADRHGEAESAALAALQSDDPVVQSKASRMLGNIEVYRGNKRAAEAHYEAAIAAAQRSGDRALLRDSKNALVHVWPVDAAADYLERTLAETLPAAERAHLQNSLAGCRLAQDRASEALDLLERAGTTYERLGLRAEAALMRANAGALHSELGDPARAEALVREAIALGRHGGQDSTVALAKNTLGMLCLADGRIEEGGAHLLAAGPGLAGRADNAAVNQGNVAIWRLVSGDVEGARDGLRQARDSPLRPPGPAQFAAYAALAEAHGGDLEGGVTLLETAARELASHPSLDEFVRACRDHLAVLSGRPATSEPARGVDARLVQRWTSSLG